jgi:hypothetical protein
MELIGDVRIPPQVAAEMVYLLVDWRTPAWIAVELLLEPHLSEALAWQHAGLLDAGEAEAVALARQAGADWLLTDDAGRAPFRYSVGHRGARLAGCPIVGRRCRPSRPNRSRGSTIPASRVQPVGFRTSPRRSPLCIAADVSVVGRGLPAPHRSTSPKSHIRRAWRTESKPPLSYFPQ